MSKSRKNTETGFALPIVLIAILVLTILGAALLSGAHTNLLMSSEEREKKAMQNALMLSYSKMVKTLTSKINDQVWPTIKGTNKILYTENAPLSQQANFDVTNSLTFATLNYQMEEGEVVRLTCTREGAPVAYGNCSGSENFPKIFE